LKSEVSAENLLNDLNEIGKAVLYFNFKRRDCKLTCDCKDIIKMIAEALRKDPTMGISIDSYTDNIGPREENLQLSRNRAETIYNALVSEGIDKQRMVINGYGESKPIADNSNVIGRAFNNRVELVKK
ncbi:MAG TPA: OmpA family protein, partial [Bacteroidales bacterium]|nr:OmpA family protein [Bacteroidales bacterium]